jgi:hypothetical protein
VELSRSSRLHTAAGPNVPTTIRPAILESLGSTACSCRVARRIAALHSTCMVPLALLGRVAPLATLDYTYAKRDGAVPIFAPSANQAIMAAQFEPPSRWMYSPEAGVVSTHNQHTAPGLSHERERHRRMSLDDGSADAPACSGGGRTQQAEHSSASLALHDLQLHSCVTPQAGEFVGPMWLPEQQVSGRTGSHVALPCVRQQMGAPRASRLCCGGRIRNERSLRRDSRE